MSRLRASLSTSAIDREIFSRVDSAKRDIFAALRLCDVRHEENPITRRRVMATRRDLEKIIGAMESVRRVRAPYDIGDLDLTGTPQTPRPKRPEPPPVRESPEE